MLHRSHLEKITLTVQRRLKGYLSKTPANFPNGINLYNSKMRGVEEIDQLKSAYELDQRLKFRFYLCLLFNQFDVTPCLFLYSI